MTDYPWGRIMRNDFETKTAKPGPWHDMNTNVPGLHLSWCGAKIRGWKAQFSTTEPPEGETRCQHCKRAKAEGRPRAFRGKR